MQNLDSILRVLAGARQFVGTAARACQVAERLELVHHALVQHRGLHFLGPLTARRNEFLQVRFEVLRLGAMLLDDVAGLTGVGGQVVELGTRRPDVLPTIRADRP